MKSKKLVTWLLAHSDERGHNVAQATVRSKTQQGAEKKLRKRLPDRVVTVVGIPGDEG